MFAFIRRRLVLTALAAVCLALTISAQTPHLEKAVVTLARHNAYFVDDRRVKESRIGPLLAVRARKNPELVAIIQCDKNIVYARVVGSNPAGSSNPAGIVVSGTADTGCAEFDSD